jgi:hypothetical protein
MRCQVPVVAGAEQAGDDMSIDVIGLGLAPDEVAVAPGLHRVEDDQAIAGADQGRLEVLSEVHRVAVAIEDGDAVVAQRDIDADEPLSHGTPFVRCRGTARR